jgi:hypothetical protein
MDNVQNCEGYINIYHPHKPIHLIKTVSKQLGASLQTTLHAVNLQICGVMVRVPGYRSRDPGSIPSATRFSPK